MMAANGLAEYARSQSKHFQEISNICRDAKISTLQVGGGSVNLNRKVLAATGLKLQGTKAVEQRIARLLGIHDRSMPSRLVDPFLVWSKNPQVAQYLKQFDEPTLIHRATEPSFEVLMEQVNV
jgi:hypothetical protein